ncbi:MAG: phosphoribosyl-AMP cyclohydrolase [Flammeovirgaceae bacterium]|nr:phosphoribosyl-AMP cyclohydrolase [Flammeovirgaceae bacterium]|tara:strand:- start:29356 stop:29808 length:453 start_codon:yes stop_codon:yes gene_type:complete
MKNLIREYQIKWANGIVELGKTKGDIVNSKKLATDFINSLYDFKNGTVQFKPTKASEFQFRNDFDSALSYFIGSNPSFAEDAGFALNPWVDVEFKNDSINVFDNLGLAMGNYFFTDLKGEKTKVEYSFVYRREGKSLKIILHHSSLPYSS